MDISHSLVEFCRGACLFQFLSYIRPEEVKIASLAMAAVLFFQQHVNIQNEMPKQVQHDKTHCVIPNSFRNIVFQVSEDDKG